MMMDGADVQAFIDKAVRDADLDTIPTPPDFDEELYLTRNPDVRAAVQRGVVISGYVHFLLSGRSEGRERATKLI